MGKRETFPLGPFLSWKSAVKLVLHFPAAAQSDQCSALPLGGRRIPLQLIPLPVVRYADRSLSDPRMLPLWWCFGITHHDRGRQRSR